MATNPPTGPVRQYVIWNGIPDVTASYELERSLTQDTATRDYQSLAVVPASQRLADGTFEYDAGTGLPNAAYICYRVRAVVGETPGPYSTETCIGRFRPLAAGKARPRQRSQRLRRLSRPRQGRG
jgi:hypothetical protein